MRSQFASTLIRSNAAKTIMKLFLLLFLVICAVIAIEGVPAKKTNAQKCDIICTADYNPVCGAVPNDKSVKPRLFGNKCALNRHNCENSAKLVEVSQDQCKNVGGIRLS